MNAFKKVTNKIGNSKIIKKPVFLVMGLIAIILVIALIYFIFLKYSPIMNFKYDGYAISGKDITENLLGSSEDLIKNKNLELTKIEEQGTIFKKLNDYFVGSKEKKEINLNYPIYINGNSAIYNLAENSTLISKDFEEIAGYPNLSIAQGKVYDGNNLERADGKEYIFVKTADEIYINLNEIKIKTTVNEYTIPVNSIIAFTENSIRYYAVNNNVLVFNQINDVDNNSNVQMVENTYTYEELLTRLGILQTESSNTENNESQTNIIKEDSTTSNTEGNQANEVEHDKTEEIETPQEESKNGYIKPEVSVEDFSAEVYTAKSTLTIKDPAGRIVEAPTFEIYKDGKIYLRRTFNNSGEIQITGLVPETEYEIIGKYVYLNENNQKVENTFYEGTFTTKGYDELGSIDIQKENGEIYSNKIQLTKVKITSDLNAEVIKGINQVEIETGEIRTVLKNSQVNSLLRGEEITIESSEGLKSDSKINYKIKFYDKNGIELKVNNNTGETRTSKEAPVAKVSIKEQDIVSVTLRLNLTNKDNVDLENYKYIVTRPNGEKVKEEKLAENEKEIVLDDLDQNQYYKIGIYADYDLNDNKGKQENVEIGNLVFATQPISTLGSLELVVENKELTSTTSAISYKIDEDRTDKRLIQILNELTINIKDGENIIKTDILIGEEISNLQQAGTKEIKYENLKSNTTYTIEITGNVQLGNTQENISVTYNYKEFTTLKIPAKVEIKNQFVTGNLIDFDVRIEDINNSVLNNKVRMELRNSNNDLIDLQELTTNEDFIRKTYEKLEENQTYKLSFYADQYNEGSTDSTYKVNYLIKEVEILTEPGISGSIGLTELSRTATGKNLVDVTSDTNWYVYPNFNTNDYYGKEYNEETKTLTLGGHGTHRRALYDLREYAGQEVTMSFKAKAVSGSQTAYIQNSKIDANRIQQIQGLSEEWKDFQFTLIVDDTGYLGFLIAGGNGLEIKELQIELGKQKTSYEEFKYVLQSNYSINLEDRRDEITTNDYYIIIYEDNNLIKTDRYEEIPEENVITNTIKTYETQAGKQYKVELVIKIKDREYVLSGLEYNTQDTEEIKGIYNKEDFLEIQPRGHYIVLGDIDITGGRYRFGGANLSFEGTIDFNGYKLIKDYSVGRTEVFYIIGTNGKLKNMVFDIYYNMATEIVNPSSLFYSNAGSIENIRINIKECNEVPNGAIKILGQNNSGTINNFILNYEVPLYVGANTVGMLRANYGVVKNGYVYGDGIKATKDATNVNYYNIVYDNKGNGQIKNIFVLSKINMQEAKSSAGSNVTFNNAESSTTENVYSVDIEDSIPVTRGPNIYNNSSGNAKNVYYFDDKIFKSSYETKTTKLALHDVNFQNQILNADNAFNVDDNVKKGYYPQLNMPNCMPAQEYIELPEVEDADLPDILSTEVLEQKAESAKVKFIINNPSAETITNISVKNLNCKIESQAYADGKSEVIALLSDPIICVSSYSVLSITTKGAYSLEYTREFKENERTVNIELFREISTVEDWIGIKNSPTENYMLVNDIDFTNQGENIKITQTVTGKIEGNNFSLKNLHLQEYLFNWFIGDIQNLDIENLIITGSALRTGIINYVEGANINNVHIKNAVISGTGAIAGLVVNSSNSTIKDCSIVNLTVNAQNEYSEFKIGGFVSTLTSGVIQNSFIQNLEINETNSLNIAGIGGIAGSGVEVGRFKLIENCYVIGNINSTGGNVGGIVGHGDNIQINSCISNVNISAQNREVSGIVGNLSMNNSYSDNKVENNLVLGNIYSSEEIENLRRISGMIDEKDNNYAYLNQLINGTITDAELGANVISYEKIFDINTYKNNLKFNDDYDFSQLSEGILPKLLSTSGEMLPNQQDNYLSLNNNLILESVEANKTGTDTFNARITIVNTEQYNITNIDIEGVDKEILRNVNANGKTYIDINGTVFKYYDSYKIYSITYENKNGEQTELPFEGKINLQFFKEIYTFEDWQSIDTTDYQNCRIMTDIDFTNRANIKSNLLVNRLETDGNMRSLKNMTLKFDDSYSGVIRNIKQSLKNIKFENITIDTEDSNANEIGIIVRSNAEIIENINLTNVKIHTNGNYIGFIGQAKGDKINNININNISITGKGYIGSLAGHLAVKTVQNLHISAANINATGNYIGGFTGYSEDVESATMTNITIEGNSSIISTGSNVGGLIGKNEGLNSHGTKDMNVRDVKVKGNQNVGGFGGNVLVLGDIEVDNVQVDGNKYVGGIQGRDGSLYNCKITNSVIRATGDYAGGVSGTINWSYYNIAAINVTVYTTGNYAGAIAGDVGINISNLYNIFAKDCTVESNSYAGGIFGRFTAGNIYRTYNNTKVIATNHTASGLIGYLDNTDMTGAYHKSSLYHNYVAGGIVNGKSNIGGFIGNIVEDLYNPELYYYSNYIEAYLDSDDTNTVSLGIGGRQNQNSYLKDTYYYKYSSINGLNPTVQNEPFIPEVSYLTEEELKQQTTYTSKLKWVSGNWNFNMPKYDKYPTINSRDLPNQEGIDIPKDSEHNLTEITDTQSLKNTEEETLKAPEQTFEYAGKQVTTYSNYSIIQDTEGNSVKRDTKIYLKDGNLFALSPNMDIVYGNLIVDNYNGKEYETVLGSDGKIYDLKEPLTYPENFINEGIESIGDNLDSDMKEVEVTYKNGDKIKFNYQTGEIISSSKAEDIEKTGLFDYLKTKISEIGNSNSGVLQEITDKYEESKELQSKLEETSVEEAIEKQNNSNQIEEGVTTTENNVTNNSLTENKYISMYNDETGQYEIYNEEELLDTSKEEVVSENEKIEANNLSEYYASEGETKNTKMGIVWIVISIIGVGIILFVLRKNLKKKNA